MNYEITVDSIATRSVNTKFGAKDTYTVISKEGQSYSMGFTKPKFKVGDTINFISEADKYGEKIDPATVKVVTAGLGGSPAVATGNAPTASRSPAFGTRPFPIPPLHGDRAIVRQNALTNARETVMVLGDNVGEDDEKVAARIIKMARMFEDYTAGDVEARAAKE